MSGFTPEFKGTTTVRIDNEARNAVTPFAPSFTGLMLT